MMLLLLLNKAALILHKGKKVVRKSCGYCSNDKQAIPYSPFAFVQLPAELQVSVEIDGSHVERGPK
jgi:hypothetical protein